MSRPNNVIGQLQRTATSDTLIDRTIDFIFGALIPWSQDVERQKGMAEQQLNEDDLNTQFFKFIQVYAKQKEFHMVIFGREEPQKKQRKADFSVSPYPETIIQGTRYNYYQPFLVIEGKRLTSKLSKNRKREYVTGENGKTSGGIQRFKLGEHGANHGVAVMVGYVQSCAPLNWLDIINSWIKELIEQCPNEWQINEQLTLEGNCNNQLIRATSNHPRSCNSNNIKLHHFWILCS